MQSLATGTGGGASSTSPLEGVQQRCRVVVASALRVHLAATERVFRQCVVEGVRVPSNVNQQPRGHEEALRGASYRLDAAKVARPGANFYVAIESGISEVWVPSGVSGPPGGSLDGTGAGFGPSSGELRHFDTGWVLVERSSSGSGPSARAAAPSAGVELPAVDVATARERGLDRGSVGAHTASRVGLLGGSASHGERAEDSVHAWLTAGRRSREALLGEALAVALGQLERACRPAFQPGPALAATAGDASRPAGAA
eukprot:TRINITY_DN19295_c0_g2_i1.p1 TRINITY_DN19295_c0_g2~~TRINITY_DN19295_c0_g2_i1.p1  ORF type:complete len:257 (-),score=49.15 TRINITY_DN19295_c0_g2_i1:249-1019(-)